jgi:ribose transport system permease protein
MKTDSAAALARPIGGRLAGLLNRIPSGVSDGDRLRAVIPVVTLLLLEVACVVLEPNVFNVRWAGITTDQAIPLVLLGASETIVIVSGGIDLSVGALLGVGNVLAATHLGSGGVTTAGGLAAIALIGLAAGALNGLIIVVLRVQPLLATLATWSIWNGIALWILPSEGGKVPGGLVDGLTGSTAGVPKSLAILLAIFLAWTWFRQTGFGTRIYAVGSDERAAFTNGTRVRSLKISVYAIAGLLAVLAGVYRAAGAESGSPIVGDTYLLPAVTAVVLGGTRLSGGKGGVGWTIIGVYILLLIGQVLLFSDVSSYYTALCQGALLILAVVSAEAISRFTKRGRR